MIALLLFGSSESIEVKMSTRSAVEAVEEPVSINVSSNVQFHSRLFGGVCGWYFIEGIREPCGFCSALCLSVVCLSRMKHKLLFVNSTTVNCTIAIHR